MKKRKSDSQSPFIIPVFIPHSGCPHQCVFCNQKSITGLSKPMDGNVFDETVKSFLSYNISTSRDVQISFYGGTFLGLSNGSIEYFLKRAAKYIDAGKVNSIRFSTRPDTVTTEKLDILKNYPVKTIELGVQSMDDHVLTMSGRGHTSSDTEIATIMIRERGFETGIQMMTGLPGDTFANSIETARKIILLKPDFVRIYPCLVIKNTPLELMYAKGEYSPFTIDKTVEIVTKLYMLFRKNGIKVIRMGLQAASDLVFADENEEGSVIAGPYHPAFGQMVFSELFLMMIKGLIYKAGPKMENNNLDLEVHPKSISKVRGLKNVNILSLKRDFGFKNININPNTCLTIDAVVVDGVETTIDQLIMGNE